MGVAGAGKTTIGRAIAAELGWQFVEGDDYHTAATVAQMRAGRPLTDADRQPWLAALHAVIAAALDRRQSLILTCSALKARYRALLRGDLRTVRFVHLTADPQTIARRLAERSGHFAGPALLASQFAELEPPDDAVAIDATQRPAEIVLTIRREFGL